MGYSTKTNSSNCYPDTTCLINKFNIRDSQKLSEIEAEITFAKAAVLESETFPDHFDFDFYKHIHRFLFEDLYDWAGRLREVNISKKGTSFCPVTELESSCVSCFKYLKNKKYFQNLNKNDFIEAIVDFYQTTNYLHPFREGNGRTQRIFISKLIKYNGYKFNFSDVNPDLLMIATIKAANGITDPLYELFKNSIK